MAGSSNSRAAATLEVIVTAIYVLLASYQLFVPPITGLANNGDFDRVMYPFGLGYTVEGMDERYFRHVVRNYAIDPWQWHRPDYVSSVDFIAAGPPAFLILWDRTLDSAKVKGVAAMSSLPMYLNTRADRLKKLDDLTEQDKIAVTSVKVSIPSIIMQMYARNKYGIDQASRFDKYTVTMTHPDGVIALLSGSGAITAHFTSPPFHQRERKD